MKIFNITLFLFLLAISTIVFANKDDYYDIPQVLAEKGYISGSKSYYTFEELNSRATLLDVIKIAARLNKNNIDKNYVCTGLVSPEIYKKGLLSQECGEIDYAILRGWIEPEIVYEDLKKEVTHFTMFKIFIDASSIPRNDDTYLTRYLFPEEEAKIFSVLLKYGLIDFATYQEFIEHHYISPSKSSVSLRELFWYTMVFDNQLLIEKDDYYEPDNGEQKFIFTFPDKTRQAVIVRESDNIKLVGFSGDRTYYSFTTQVGNTIAGGDDYKTLIIVDKKTKSVKYFPIDYSEIIVTPRKTLFKLFGIIVIIEGRKISTFPLPINLKNIPMKYITFSPNNTHFAYVGFGEYKKADKIVVINIATKEVEVLKDANIGKNTCILGWRDENTINIQNECMEF